MFLTKSQQLKQNKTLDLEVTLKNKNMKVWTQYEQCQKLQPQFYGSKALSNLIHE